MDIVTVAREGSDGLVVRFAPAEHALGPRPRTEDEEGTAETEEGPSPIAPEAKELLWGLGAFLVFLVLMRLYLVPKVRQGMQARYGKIRADHEAADATRQTAQGEVADYEAQLVAVKADANARIDAARQQLEQERADRIGEANAAIAERRSAAAAEAETARAAARESVADAVVSVAGRTVELSTGRRPDDNALRAAVTDVMSAGVRS